MRNLAFTLAITVALCAGTADAQTFTTLVQFTGTGGTASGANPYGSLTVSGTTLYGMTSAGSHGAGNIFSVGTDGTAYQELVSFTGGSGTAIGISPFGGLTLSGTTLYGMTSKGGPGQFGNVFSVGTDGKSFRNLVSFTGTNGPAAGQEPRGNLTLVGATLYGMTLSGGTNGGSGNDGNVFSIGTDGTGFQTLVYFSGTLESGGGETPEGSLVPSGSSGSTLYGVTGRGGADNDGLLFSLGTSAATFNDFLSFTGNSGAANGFIPTGGPVLSGTTLYGMTDDGGPLPPRGNIYSVGTNGTGYRNLLSFTGSGNGAANGSNPWATLILSGTTLYGTTLLGGTSGRGNIFSVGIDGSHYQDLYDFTGSSDGGYPQGDLTLSNGTLFGMASGVNLTGSKVNNGAIFAFALPTPEPGTLAVVGCGAAALGTYRWRRRRRRRKSVLKGRRFTQRTATPW